MPVELGQVKVRKCCVTMGGDGDTVVVLYVL
jgi:hypothetical protein